MDRALNFAARVLLRVASPARAHSLMLRVGRVLPQRRSVREARMALGRMGRVGTCLSRSIALAATCPQAEVVIGVTPTPAPGGGHIEAHAWVELRGEPLDAEDPRGQEIARLRQVAPGG